MNHRSRYRRSSTRGGAVLIVVMAATFITVALLAASLQRAVRENRQLRLTQQALQAEWLARSAVDRAAARLAASSDYHGESWSIASPGPLALGGAVVTIRVEPVAEQSDALRVRAQADYPADPARRVRASHETLIHLNQPGS